MEARRRSEASSATATRVQWHLRLLSYVEGVPPPLNLASHASSARYYPVALAEDCELWIKFQVGDVEHAERMLKETLHLARIPSSYSSVRVVC